MTADARAEQPNLLKQTGREFIDDECPRMAAALAYYTVFSLPPLLVLLVLLAGLFLGPQAVENWIETQVGGMIGEGASEQMRTMVENAQQRVEGGFSFGLILSIAGLLFGATGAFAQLQQALNKAWEVKPDPAKGGLKQFLVKRVFSLGMILIIAFLLAVSLLLSSFIAAFSGQLAGILPGALSTTAAWLIDLGVSLLLFTLLFATIFKVLPDAHVAWRDTWIGALATSVLFVVGKFLIGLYVGQSDPGAVFGAAAALALILVWVYYSAMILFLGAEFTQVWARRKGEGIEPDEDAVRVVEKEHVVRPAGADATE